ncbi:MAG TPA: DUF2199 domain-containing protein [Alphaproteobacteria bacterium]|jgi:hypothetical protein
MAVRFTCTKCGETHEGLPDIGFDAPVFAEEMGAGAGGARIRLTSDFCEIDGRYFFVRCVLPVPVLGEAEPFGWGVWMSAGEATFRRYAELFERDEEGTMAPWAGYLSNRLPAYENTVGLIGRIRPRGEGTRPLVELEPTSHLLAVHQRDGMPLSFIQGVVEPLLHR